MHHVCGVSSCGYTTQDEICESCTSQLVSALTAIATGGVHRIRYHKQWDPMTRTHTALPPVVEYHPGLWEDLETTLTRQAKVTAAASPVRGRGETPLVFHEQASDVKSELLRTVRHWKARFMQLNPHLPPPRGGVVEACTWLARFPALLADLPDAPNMHADFWNLAGASRNPDYLGSMYQVINTYPDRIYLGLCGGWVEGYDFPCAHNLFALKEREWAVCPYCHNEHNVEQRHGMLMQRVEGEVLNSQGASRLLASVGIDIPSSTIRSWTQRRNVRGKWIEQRLFPHDYDKKTGKPLYLVKSILDVWHASLEKKGKAA